MTVSKQVKGYTSVVMDTPNTSAGTMGAAAAKEVSDSFTCGMQILTNTE